MTSDQVAAMGVDMMLNNPSGFIPDGLGHPIDKTIFEETGG